VGTNLSKMAILIDSSEVPILLVDLMLVKVNVVSYRDLKKLAVPITTTRAKLLNLNDQVSGY
jgi:hypothetical protein